MNKKTLKKLMELPGISGQEENIAKELKEKLIANKFEILRDNLGSVWGKKVPWNDEKPILMIDSHLDEVGFQVTGMKDNGLLQFEEHGFVQKSLMNGTILKVWPDGQKEPLIGVVLLKKPNPKTGESPVSEIDELLLDVGASNKEELKSMRIQLGTQITFYGNVNFQGNRVIGKSADNRAGVALIFELIDYIVNKKFDYNIVIGASVQEEVGLRGARTSTQMIKPDLSLVVDISPAGDSYKSQQSEGILGEGTLIRYKDALTVFPKVATKFAQQVAIKNKIKTQDYFGKGGTNSGVIHLLNSGSVTLPLGFVARNLHSSSQVFDIGDYEETLKLAKGMLTELSASKIKNFKQH